MELVLSVYLYMRFRVITQVTRLFFFFSSLKIIAEQQPVSTCL